MKRMTWMGLLALGVGCFVASAQEPPETVSPERIWNLAASPEETRAALLKVLEEEGLELEEAGPDILQSAFVSFDSQRFAAESVAEPPPVLAEDYLFLQRAKATQGRFRLRARLEPQGEGTRVTVGVEIVVQAFHAMVVGTTEAPRVSNGVIEDYFRQLLDTALAGADSGKKKTPSPDVRSK